MSSRKEIGETRKKAKFIKKKSLKEKDSSNSRVEKKSADTEKRDLSLPSCSNNRSTPNVRSFGYAKSTLSTSGPIHPKCMYDPSTPKPEGIRQRKINPDSKPLEMPICRDYFNYKLSPLYPQLKALRKTAYKGKPIHGEETINGRRMTPQDVDLAAFDKEYDDMFRTLLPSDSDEEYRKYVKRSAKRGHKRSNTNRSCFTIPDENLLVRHTPPSTPSYTDTDSSGDEKSKPRRRKKSSVKAKNAKHSNLTKKTGKNKNKSAKGKSSTSKKYRSVTTDEDDSSLSSFKDEDDSEDELSPVEELCKKSPYLQQVLKGRKCKEEPSLTCGSLLDNFEDITNIPSTSKSTRFQDESINLPSTSAFREESGGNTCASLEENIDIPSIFDLPSNTRTRKSVLKRNSTKKIQDSEKKIKSVPKRKLVKHKCDEKNMHDGKECDRKYLSCESSKNTNVTSKSHLKPKNKRKNLTEGAVSTLETSSISRSKITEKGSSKKFACSAKVNEIEGQQEQSILMSLLSSTVPNGNVLNPYTSSSSSSTANNDLDVGCSNMQENVKNKEATYSAAKFPDSELDLLPYREILGNRVPVVRVTRLPITGSSSQSMSTSINTNKRKVPSRSRKSVQQPNVVGPKKKENST